MGMQKEVKTMSDEKLVDIIRTAMGEGCIHPCHVYDCVDEVLKRFTARDKTCDKCSDKTRAKEAK